MTANHLNEVVKKITGQTAKEVIQDRLLLEAKRYATYSDCTLSEIAFHLGYEDAAHFSRMFKKCSGMNFVQFRAAIRKKYK